MQQKPVLTGQLYFKHAHLCAYISKKNCTYSFENESSGEQKLNKAHATPIL